MLQASPANARTMQHHNCMQQALVAEGVCTIPKEHAREEEENEERSCSPGGGHKVPRPWVVPLP